MRDASRRDPAGRALRYLTQQASREASLRGLPPPLPRASSFATRKSVAHMATANFARVWGVGGGRGGSRNALRALRLAVGWLRNRSLGLGFASWRLLAFQRRNAGPTDGAETALRHMMHRQLALGWNQWRALARARVRVLRVALRWSLRKLVRGLVSWRQTTDEACHATRIARAALNTLLRRSLSRGWRAWAEMREMRRRFVSTLSRSLARLMRRGLARGWHSWYDAHVEATRLMRKLRRAAGFLARRELARGWNAWTGRVADRNAAMRLLRKSVSFWGRLDTCKAFGLWEQQTERSEDSGSRLVAVEPPPSPRSPSRLAALAAEAAARATQDAATVQAEVKPQARGPGVGAAGRAAGGVRGGPRRSPTGYRGKAVGARRHRLRPAIRAEPVER